jgi:alpha-N-acetylglucosamine transferase
MLFPTRRRRWWKSRSLLEAISLLVCFIITLEWLQIISFSPLLSLFEGTAIEKASRLAYATILLPCRDDSRSTEPDLDPDPYFTSIRLLNYQLQYDKDTRSSMHIPFIVLATSEVQSWKLEQLSNEGAIVIGVEPLTSSWLQPGVERWKDVMAKLRLFTLTNYDLIMFLDADTFIISPLDGAFSDPAAQIQWTLMTNKIEKDEAPLPSTYAFATLPEVLRSNHPKAALPYPNFNAGFFIFSPSTTLFNYYLSLLELPGRFDSTYPEQNLLNYAHREGGNMPWRQMDMKKGWNTNLPNLDDLSRVKSVHVKGWAEEQYKTTELSMHWGAKRDEMEKYFRGIKR